MPDITPAQIAAVATAIIGFAAAAGIPMSNDLQNRLITMITVGAPVIIAADAYIRNGRARIGAAQVTATAAAEAAQALPAGQPAPAIPAAPEPAPQALAAAPPTAAVPASADAATAAPESLSQLLQSGALSELAEGGVLAIKPEEELFVVRWVRPDAAAPPPATEPSQPATPAAEGSA
jgi:hypothetical protein